MDTPITAKIAGSQTPTFIYNHRFNRHPDSACGETFIPSASQLRSKKAFHHGRQITESQPEEIDTETKQNQRCQRKSKGGRYSQASRRQEKINGPLVISLELNGKRDEFSSSETSTRPGLEMRSIPLFSSFVL
ncbi:MAG TPA: hypothetical protein VGJ73_13960 [Verrucomicrobiae bacterium]